MPISGVVITSNTNQMDEAMAHIEQYPAVEIHGTDEKGHIVAVLETVSSEEMEKLIKNINEHEHILNVGVTYLNTEDEAALMAEGKQIPKPFGFRKPSGSQDVE